MTAPVDRRSKRTARGQAATGSARSADPPAIDPTDADVDGDPASGLDDRGDPRRPTVGIALYGDLTFDSRVRREARSLAEGGFDVVVVCLGDRSPPDAFPPNVRIVVSRPDADEVLPGTPSPFGKRSRNPLPALTGRVRWLRGYVANLRAWGREVPAAVSEADIWHLNDFVALAAVSPRLPAGVPIVYDAHDLFLETGTARRLPWLARMLLRRYERRLIRRVSAVVTVNNAVAKVLVRRYRPRRIEVVYNCPDWVEAPAARGTRIRDATGIPADAPVVLHHGRLGATRGIEELMEALLEPGLERVHLVLMGFGEKRLDYLATGQEPRFGGRVHLLDPVAPADLIDWVASADLAAMPIQAATLNLYLSTPNKLFESLAAGVPVVASNFPAISEIVLDEELGPFGAVCDPSSAASIAAAMRSVLDLDPDARAALRKRCREASRIRWSWQVESRTLLRLYRDLTGVEAAGRLSRRPLTSGETGDRPR